jgi:hypothetical protein
LLGSNKPCKIQLILENDEYCILKNLASIIVLWGLASLVSGSIVSDLQNEQLSYVGIFHQAVTEGTTIQDSVIVAIDTTPEDTAEIVSAAIVVSPGSMEAIIVAAIDVGATAEEIAPSCRTILTTNEIELFVVTSIEENARPEPIIIVCLSMLPKDAIPRVIAAALSSTNETMYGRILMSAYETTEILGMDALALVTEGLAQSGLTINGETMNLQSAFNIVGELVAPTTLTSGPKIDSEDSGKNTESPVLVNPNPPSRPPVASPS